MRLRPKATTKTSPTISSDTISDMLSDLKAIIAAIALDWSQRDDTERTLHSIGRTPPKRPTIGSREWHSHLEFALAYHNDPDPDARYPDESLASVGTARRITAQDPKHEQRTSTQAR